MAVPELDFYAPPCDYTRMRKQRVNTGRDVMYAWRPNHAQTEFDLHTGARRPRRQPFCTGAQQRDKSGNVMDSTMRTLNPLLSAPNTNTTSNNSYDDNSNNSTRSTRRRSKDTMRAGANMPNSRAGTHNQSHPNSASATLWQGAHANFPTHTHRHQTYRGPTRGAPVYAHNSITLCRPREVSSRTTASRAAETVMFAITCNTADVRRRAREQHDTVISSGVNGADTRVSGGSSGLDEKETAKEEDSKDNTPYTHDTHYTDNKDNVHHSTYEEKSHANSREEHERTGDFLAQLSHGRRTFVVDPPPAPALSGLSSLSVQQNAAVVAATTQRWKRATHDDRTASRHNTRVASANTLNDLPTAELAFSLRPSYVARVQKCTANDASTTATTSVTRLPVLSQRRGNRRSEAAAHDCTSVFYCNDTLQESMEAEEEEQEKDKAEGNVCGGRTTQRASRGVPHAIKEGLPIEAKAVCVYSIRVRNQVSDGELTMMKRPDVLRRGKPVHAVIC